MVEARAVGKEYPLRRRLGALLAGPRGRRTTTALTDLSFAIAPGETVAVMGENGAGKTTLLRLLAGLTPPSRGQLTVAGCDAAREGAALRRQVGLVIADERSFSLRLSARENLAFFAALHHQRRPRALARADELLARLGLGPLGDRPYYQLSSGQKQRLAFARGLVGSPRLLLLDEPSRGLDRAGRAMVRELLIEARGQGTTCVLSTHDLAEATALADRLLVLGQGRLIALAPPAAAGPHLEALHG